jgi:phosphoglycolate phosphatase-like HAD superfamily hydrolase
VKAAIKESAILFDLDGTLIDHDSAEEKAALFLFDRFPVLNHFKCASFSAIWRQSAEKYFALYAEGKLSFPDQRRKRIRALFNAAKHEISDEQADEIFEIYLTNYEENWILYGWRTTDNNAAERAMRPVVLGRRKQTKNPNITQLKPSRRGSPDAY